MLYENPKCRESLRDSLIDSEKCKADFPMMEYINQQDCNFFGEFFFLALKTL